ncbi:hypothetical protein [Prescottella equi]|uniref:hypothetical protein n=2 Tax=Rhodococcus hoagii TaxID=43767 RepID=UPI00197D14E4|nr:hypothetical protein [Prescottella equi]MBM4517679.1 hypothetical protein [Prescottella equi]
MSITSLVMILGTLGLFWYGVLVLRPGIARARVRAEVSQIRADLVDAMLDGTIPMGQPAALDLIAWCDELVDHPRDYTLGSALSLVHACKKNGIEPASEPGLIDLHQVDAPAGRKLIHEARANLDRVVGWYLVRSSTMWWAFSIIDRLARRAIARRELEQQSTTKQQRITANSPTALSKELREAETAHRGLPDLDLFLAGGRRFAL